LTETWGTLPELVAELVAELVSALAATWTGVAAALARAAEAAAIAIALFMVVESENMGALLAIEVVKGPGNEESPGCRVCCGWAYPKRKW
jgi:hypothetical protein